MNEIKKIFSLVGQVLGLIIGDNVTTSATDIAEKHHDNYAQIF